MTCISNRLKAPWKKFEKILNHKLQVHADPALRGESIGDFNLSSRCFVKCMKVFKDLVYNRNKALHLARW